MFGKNDQIMTTPEAADEIGVSEETIRRLLRDGVIRGFKVREDRKAHWRIWRRDWEDYLNRVAYNVPARTSSSQEYTPGEE